jgi:hypothetical protein
MATNGADPKTLQREDYAELADMVRRTSLEAVLRGLGLACQAIGARLASELRVAGNDEGAARVNSAWAGAAVMVDDDADMAHELGL